MLLRLIVLACFTSVFSPERNLKNEYFSSVNAFPWLEDRTVAILLLITKENRFQTVFTRQHRCRQDSVSSYWVTTQGGRGKTSVEGGWFVPRSFVWSRHSKATALCLSLLAKGIPVCVCQRGREQVIMALITRRFKESTDKRACFETGNTLDSETGRHVTAARCRKAQTDWLTDWLTGNETKTHSRVEGQAGVGGGACRGVQGGGMLVCVSVVSVFDNNSGDVIIGSLIKINLISAPHNIFCLLKRCLASLEAGINAPFKVIQSHIGSPWKRLHIPECVYLQILMCAFFKNRLPQLPQPLFTQRSDSTFNMANN